MFHGRLRFDGWGDGRKVRDNILLTLDTSRIHNKETKVDQESFGFISV